jgi:hypothetical protein
LIIPVPEVQHEPCQLMKSPDFRHFPPESLASWSLASCSQADMDGRLADGIEQRWHGN